MPNQNLMDLEQLLAPIDDDKGVGPDLREERTAEYTDLRQTRRDATKAEKDAAIDPERHADAYSHWKSISRLAPTILSKQSKDLEVAASYTEALIRLEGLDGLLAGSQLINALVEKYWQDLYPLPDDEDGLETRMKPLIGIFGGDREGTLKQAVSQLALVPEGNGNDNIETFCLWHYDSAVQASRIEDPNKRAERSARLGYTLDDIEKAVAKTPASFFENLIQSADELKAVLNALSQQFNTLSSEYRKLDPKEVDEDLRILPIPSINQIKTVVEENYISAIKHLAKSHLEKAAEPEPLAEPEEAPSASSEASASTVAAPSQGAIKVSQEALMTRENALAQLEEVAKYFRETEPHTPIAGALDRVVRWGKMPLENLMFELLPNDAARQAYSQLTGVSPSASDDEVSAAAVSNSYSAPAPTQNSTPSPEPAQPAKKEQW